MSAATDTEYEVVIGLEIHVQLKTRTKMFCGCELTFGEEPNTHTCPVCLALPGALPVTNAEAIHFGLLIGLALGCELNDRSIFDRKQYFYPDSPKGYQISQNTDPICSGGELGGVRIHRAHLEEDAAKNIHVGGSGRIQGSASTVVDFNRGGTPLCEIVTEPDIRSSEQAGDFLRLLRTTMRAIGVSDVNMEEGSLRCDANISIRSVGETELGVKTELKNMNSFRNIEKGIRAEAARQESLLRAGQEVSQETLHFDPKTERLTSMRSKEEAHDYRYFPEPDLTPLDITPEMVERAQASLPELPAAREVRFRDELGLHPEAARMLSWRAELGDYFEAVQAASGETSADASAVANWVTNELTARLGDEDPAASKVRPEALAVLVGLVAAGKVTGQNGRKVLDKLVAEGGDPTAIVETEGLASLDDADALGTAVAKALEDNPEIADRIAGGDFKPMGVIIGAVMKETKGRADGKQVTKLVRERLAAR